MLIAVAAENAGTSLIVFLAYPEHYVYLFDDRRILKLSKSVVVGCGVTPNKATDWEGVR